MKIGVIGNGFVGSAIAEGFKHYGDVKIYDLNPARSPHALKETIGQDYIFICLPTPMSDDGTGSCNLSYINSFFNKIKDLKCEGTFIIKSTVPIYTTSDLRARYPSFNILHSPEFLTARTAKIDFITPSRVIIGYPKNFYSPEDCVPQNCLNLFKNRFKGVKCLLTTSEESELIKYVANCFFATKISFFNEMKLLSDKVETNFETILEGVLSDGRIAHSHHQVPGHDGKMGFGGDCFPKDLNALITIMRKNDISPNVLLGARTTNGQVRGENSYLINPQCSDLSGCGHDYIN